MIADTCLIFQTPHCYFQLGVIFFKSDGVIPLAHAIWHIHVVFGALIHYNAVRKYLITPENQL